jgi:hypothetical protein
MFPLKLSRAKDPSVPLWKVNGIVRCLPQFSFVFGTFELGMGLTPVSRCGLVHCFNFYQAAKNCPMTDKSNLGMGCAVQIICFFEVS